MVPSFLPSTRIQRTFTRWKSFTTDCAFTRFAHSLPGTQLLLSLFSLHLFNPSSWSDASSSISLCRIPIRILSVKHHLLRASRATYNVESSRSRRKRQPPRAPLVLGRPGGEATHFPALLPRLSSGARCRRNHHTQRRRANHSAHESRPNIQQNRDISSLSGCLHQRSSSSSRASTLLERDFCPNVTPQPLWDSGS